MAWGKHSNRTDRLETAETWSSAPPRMAHDDDLHTLRFQESNTLKGRMFDINGDLPDNGKMCELNTKLSTNYTSKYMANILYVRMNLMV